MSSVTLPIPDGLRREAERLAQERGLPLSDVIIESVRRYVAAAELKRIQDSLRPYAEAQGFFTDEDVFKAIS